jgi:hypothetical protein
MDLHHTRRPDRVLHVGERELAVHVVGGEPLELVGIEVDTDGLVAVELHNPSEHRYCAHAKLIAVLDDGTPVASSEFTLESVDELRTGVCHVAVPIPDLATGITLIVTGRLLDHAGGATRD